MYEILSQEKNVSISEMVSPPPYNSTISFEMSILEENIDLISFPIDESVVFEHKEELVHSPSQVI
jgi:hypothetical protein